MVNRHPIKLSRSATTAINLVCKSAIKQNVKPVTCDLSKSISEFKALCQRGHLESAICALHHLEQHGYQRSSYTYVCLLQACIQSGALREGKIIHGHIVRNESELNIFLSTTIANMYARCGSIEDAQVVFGGMPERNMVTWSMMIEAYCRYGKFEEAYDAFWKMQTTGLKPDNVIVSSVLKACAGLRNLLKGKKIHDLMKSHDICPVDIVGNSLLNMYVKCDSMDDAQQVFENMDKKDAGSWSIMMSGYAKSGNAKRAMSLFSQMQSSNVVPDDVTFLSILNVCSSIGNLEQAKNIHGLIKTSGVKMTGFMWNTLIDMYAKCGSLVDAEIVFNEIPERDAVTWNAMIAGYTKHRQHEKALQLHRQMITEGVHPDEVSFVSVLTACTSANNLELGRQIHSQVALNKCFVNVYVENALIYMYGECGSLNHAHQIFERMKSRNVVSWNTIIAAFTKHELDEDVLGTFEQMMSEGMEPDEMTYVSLLNSCANITALDHGLKIHHDILVNAYDFDVFVGNALVDMYAKCGRIMDAVKVFVRMPERDVVTWNATLAGYAQHGLGHEAIWQAGLMVSERRELNHVSFVSILSACSHAGLVDEGRYCFQIMTQGHGVLRAIEHYGCMVDLLGRAGLLDEADKLLSLIPHEGSIVLWRALLGACKIHGNVNLAIRAAECVLDMDPNDDAVLVLLLNIQASAGKWEDQTTLIRIMSGGDQEENVFVT